MKWFIVIFVFLTNDLYAADGKLIFTKGKTTVNNEIVAVHSGVKDGDIIKTEVNGLAIVKLNSGVTLKIKESTELKIELPSRVDKITHRSFLLKAGSFFVDVVPGKSQKVSVKSKNAIMGVRGTRFFVSSQKENDRIWMCVNKGLVEVSIKGKAGSVLVKAGQGVSIEKELPQPRSYSWTQKLNWNLEGDYEAVKSHLKNDDIQYDFENFQYD